MRKIWQKGILGIIMLGIFLLPISAGINIKENKLAIGVEINEVRGQEEKDWWFGWTVPVVGTSGFKDFTEGTSDENKEACETASAKWENDGANKDTPGNISIPCKQGEKPLVKAGVEIVDPNNPGVRYGCSPLPWDWGACLVKLIYDIIFQPLAFFARLAAKILDFFIYYSISDEAYVHTFVEKGWGAVRDVANIFFIIMLLYVAIKTVLSLNVTDNKRLVGWIIIIALIINFSLFTTKVVIDASNILAKIFYNNIKSVDGDNQPLKEGEEAEKSITIGLVRTFDPHKIFIESAPSDKNIIKDNIGTFAAVLFMGILLMGYMIYMFMSVALLFVARVISLWISMIFSPLAFVSYAVPFDMGKMGRQKWWPELFKNAFLAPLFIFFLYIIILFGDFMKIVIYGDSDSGYVLVPDVNSFETYMKNLIPFIIVFVLLMKAKELAVEYSGEMGKGITKAGAVVGGLALGAATGGVAMAARGTLGAGSSLLLRSGLGEKLKTKADEKGLGGWAARMALGGTTSLTKSSFDVRQTKLGGELSKISGMNFQSSNLIGLGSKTGGVVGAAQRKSKKDMEEFETHKTKMTNDEVAEWNTKRKPENKLKNPDGTDITTAEQLNNYRMKKFNENIGKTGFVYSIAYSTAKTTLKEGASEEDIEKRAKNIKLGIGVTAVLAGGALGAGVGAGMLGGGVLGGLAGGALGAGSVTEKIAEQTEAERLTRGTMKKQIETLGGLENRMKDLTIALDKAKGLERKIIIPSALVGQPPTIKIEKLNIVDEVTGKIDGEKLRSTIAENESMQFTERSKLNKNPDDKNAQETLKALIEEKEILSTMKTYEKELLNLTEKKGEMNKSSGSSSTPPAAAKP